MIRRLLTRNYTMIPLFYAFFDLKKFRKNGAANSCDIHMHPLLHNDVELLDKVKDVIDYIRENYNMEDIA